MKKISTVILMLSFAAIQAQTSIFNTLLQTNVDTKGKVNYISLKNNEALLDNYLIYLNNTIPTKEWSLNKQKAFWINAYNSYTIKIILNNYPLKSITNIENDGRTAWKTPFVKVGEKTYTLDYIEHEILRKKFNDPRIHVGINCASVSCPKLGNIAFTEDNVEASLENLMKEFINDVAKNKISEGKVEVSEIFKWFKTDFTTDGSMIDYIKKYSDVKISKKAKIKYLPYNWNLNEK
tara:strand:- start:2107 stop:2814 length:708 start_codon:yes stop_codon:yes gene_type:complete